MDLDGDYDLWFRAHECKGFLSRPDHYVFGTVQNNDELPALVDELAEQLTAAGWKGLDQPQPANA